MSTRLGVRSGVNLRSSVRVLEPMNRARCEHCFVQYTWRGSSTSNSAPQCAHSASAIRPASKYAIVM
jgi:hypothetical protein